MYGVVSLNLALCFLVLPMVLALFCSLLGLEAGSKTSHIVMRSGFVCVVFAEIAAFFLGIFGLSQPNTRKIFSTLGIVFSSLFLVFMTFLFTFALISGFIAVIQSKG